MGDNVRKRKNEDKKSAPTKRNKRESAVIRLGINCISIANAVEQEFAAKGISIKFSDRAISRVSQIISQTVEKQYVKDLYTYASHAKRATPNVNDAKLLYHRNPEIKKRVEDLVKTFDKNTNEEPEIIIMDNVSSNVIQKFEASKKGNERVSDLQSDMKSSHVIFEFENKSNEKMVTLINDPFYDDYDLANWAQVPTTSKANNENHPSSTNVNNSTFINTPEYIPETVNKEIAIVKQKSPVKIAEPIPKIIEKEIVIPEQKSPVKVFKNSDPFYDDDDLAWLVPKSTDINAPKSSDIPPSSHAEQNNENKIDEQPKQIIGNNQDDDFYNDDWIPQVVQQKTAPSTSKVAETGNWFQPDSHSTPINAEFRKGETLNLSIDSTPQRVTLNNFATPRPIKVAGLRRPSKK